MQNRTARPASSRLEASGVPLDHVDVRVLHVGRDVLGAGGWDHSQLAGGHWRLYHNDSPGATLFMAGEAIALEPGAIYIIPPSSRMASRNENPFVQVFVHFDVVCALPILLEEAILGPTVVPEIGGYSEAVVELGLRVEQSHYPNIGVECMAKAIVYQAFAQCLNALSTDRVRSLWMRLDSLRPVMPALLHIEQHFGGEIRNPFLAELCRMSEDHFIRRFREAVGVPPVQYVLKRRVAVAAQRLLFTADTIDEIAEATGFTDRFYFSRMFAREMGRPPAAYRSGLRTQRPDGL
ncbi:MAG: AraC family transcriptional regulator [Capsulimonadaceae bacterium]|nr:AraC family transcriptional regulator [Capsulimonadaceae bacterium]